MTTYTNINSTAFDWVDVNTLSGAAIGTEFTIQNLGSDAFYIRESNSKPLDVDGPLVLSRQEGEMSKAYISAGSSTIWVKPTIAGDLIKLAVYS